MARVARIALDLALVSIKTVSPVVSKIWTVAKSKVLETKAKPLLDNMVVSKIESGVGTFTSVLLEKMSNWRDQQLPAEKKYLEKELEKVKNRLQVDSPKRQRYFTGGGDGQGEKKKCQ